MRSFFSFCLANSTRFQVVISIGSFDCVFAPQHPNNRLRELGLSGDHIGVEGARALRDAIQVPERSVVAIQIEIADPTFRHTHTPAAFNTLVTCSVISLSSIPTPLRVIASMTTII